MHKTPIQKSANIVINKKEKNLSSKVYNGLFLKIFHLFENRKH